MKKLIKGKIYMVSWIDTFTSNDWKNIEEVKEEAKTNSCYIHTYGHYIGYSEGYEMFAGSFNSNERMRSWGAVTYIPRGTIKKIESL